MNTSLFKKWWLLTLKGIFMIAFGTSLLMNPYVTTHAIVIFLGVTLLTSGALSTWFALANRKSIRPWKSFLAEGGVEIMIGLFLLSSPSISLYSIIMLGSFWIYILGAFQIVFGIQFKDHFKGWRFNISYGIIAIIIGFAIAIYPMSGVIGFAVVFGITLLVFGLFFISTSHRMKKHVTNYDLPTWSFNNYKKIHKKHERTKEKIQRENLEEIQKAN